MAGLRVRLVAYVLLLALVPGAAAAASLGAAAARGETRQADERLAGGMRGALAAYDQQGRIAGRTAKRIAATARARTALEQHRTLRFSPRGAPNVGVLVAAKVEGGARAPLALVRTAPVAAAGRVLGEVVVTVPLDVQLLGQLGRQAGLAAEDTLDLVRDGRLRTGERLQLVPGKATAVTVAGARYRVLSAPLPEPPGV